MDFEKAIILENDKVCLRPLEHTDFDLLLPFSISEPELWKYSLLPANGKENLRKYIDLALQQRINKTAYPFIVYDKLKKQYAGSTRFYDYQNLHQTTQLGYTWYGQTFQGTGININCKFLMLEFAFDTLELERVEFRADNNNKRSIAAMKKIGCTEEGVLRSNCKSVDGRRDSIVLSILKNEWQQNIKQRLTQTIH